MWETETVTEKPLIVFKHVNDINKHSKNIYCDVMFAHILGFVPAETW